MRIRKKVGPKYHHKQSTAGPGGQFALSTNRLEALDRCVTVKESMPQSCNTVAPTATYFPACSCLAHQRGLVWQCTGQTTTSMHRYPLLLLQLSGSCSRASRHQQQWHYAVQQHQLQGASHWTVAALQHHQGIECYLALLAAVALSSQEPPAAHHGISWYLKHLSGITGLAEPVGSTETQFNFQLGRTLAAINQQCPCIWGESCRVSNALRTSTSAAAVASIIGR